jgi:hypothetical protein
MNSTAAQARAALERIERMVECRQSGIKIAQPLTTLGRYLGYLKSLPAESDTRVGAKVREIERWGRIYLDRRKSRCEGYGGAALVRGCLLAECEAMRVLLENSQPDMASRPTAPS